MQVVHTRLISNILAVFSSTLLSRILKFLLFVYAARVFGPEDYGRFSYVMVIALLSVIAADLGVSRYVVQQLSRDASPTARYLGHNLLLNWGLGSLITLLTWLYFSWFDPRPGMALLALLLVGGSVVETTAGCYHAVFQSRQKMVAHAFLLAAGNTMVMLTGFVVVYMTRDLAAFAAIHLLASTVNLLLSRALAKRRGIRADMRFDPAVMRRLIRHGLPFSLTAAFIFIYYHIDSLFLEHYHGSQSVGYYNAAYRLVEVPLVFLSTITLALFPALSHLDAHDRAELRNTTRQAVFLAILLSLPGALAICWDAVAVTALIYGPAYAQTATALAVLVLSVAVIYPNAMLGTLLRGIGKQTLTMWITAAGAGLNCLLNLLFIPSYGLPAAAATTVATELFIGGMYAWHARKQIDIMPESSTVLRIIAINAAMLAVLWLGGDLPLLLRFCLAGLVYLLLLQITGLFPWRRWKQLRIKKT